MNQNKQNEILEELEHYISYRKEYCEKHFSKNPDVYLVDTYYNGRIDSYSECLDKITEMKKDLYKEKEMIEHNDACTLIKNNAVKEFGEFVLSLFPSDENFTTISRLTIKQKIREMTESKDCTDCIHFLECECFSGMTCDEFKDKNTESKI